VSVATVAELVNAGLNPLIAWLLNREKGCQPLWGLVEVEPNVDVVGLGRVGASAS
jgi:hypothetical protein